jgi:hypothetical protein
MARDACAELPPVQAEYTPKGKWEELGGLKSCKTSPRSHCPPKPPLLLCSCMTR